MVKIGVISDTHGTFDAKVREFLKDVDMLWHIGDIGNIATLDIIAAFKPLTAVFGNADDATVRRAIKRDAVFMCEGVKVAMTHIGGYPGHYYPEMRALIKEHNPKIVLSGHSHILRVMYDEKFDHLHINPGAAGRHGFHKVRTALRFVIDGEDIKEMEVGEWQRNEV